MTRTSRARRSVVRDGARAAVPAAILSGLPSTVLALLARRDPLEASLAAGSMILPAEQRRGRLLLVAIPVHLALSAGWSIVMSALLPRRNPLLEGTLSGLVISALDLGLAGSRFSRVRALPLLPQIADHVAFGIIVAASLERPR